jgi:hypothetical protein
MPRRQGKKGQQFAKLKVCFEYLLAIKQSGSGWEEGTREATLWIILLYWRSPHSSGDRKNFSKTEVNNSVFSPFMRIHQLLGYVRISQNFMEPKCSLPYSQETSLFPILTQINQCIPSHPKIHFNNISPTTFPIKMLHTLLFWHACYMLFQSHFT